jgi:hypothetical protein
VVTVAATGAGIALPLLGTGMGTAHAADSGTWENVAICETGGQWDHHSHNGFYGGLDITLTDWVLYGGLQYADRPDHATRAAQITVAEKILATLGPDVWRDCEIGTGLLDEGTPAADGDGASAGDEHDYGHGHGSSSGKSGKGQDDDQGGDEDAASDGGTASTDPADTTPSPESTDTSGTTGGTTPTDPAGSAEPTTPTDPADTATTTPADPTDSPDPADTSAPPSADATGTPTAPDAPATTGGGRHARPYSPTDEALAAADRATRTVTNAITEGAAADSDKGGKTDTASHKAPSTYTVDSGDSLSGIAAAQDVAGGWQQLYDANQQLIGDDPNLIKPGQILDLG